MAHTESCEAAKSHIASIREGKGLIEGKEMNDNAADLERALKIVSDDLYNKSTHFLLELIQNADDNAYTQGIEPTLDITLYGDYLRVDCNEVGFSAKNIEAICRIGSSTKASNKKAGGYVGEKGIGFKSVFKVADVVFVNSGYYSFRFEKNGPLGMIAPIWTDDFPVPVKQGYTTVYLQFNKDCDKEDLLTEIKALDPRMLIFLRRLRQINIKVSLKRAPTFSRPLSFLGIGKNQALARSLTRLPDSTGQLGRIITLRQDEHIFKYLVFTHLANRMPLEEKRQGVQESQLLLAFPVTSTLTPHLEAQQVYAFMPIRDYGLQFLIQGDFLLIANRQDIDGSPDWNRRLRDEAIQAFVDTAQQFNNSPLRYTWPRYLPARLSTVSGFFAVFKTELLDKLAKEPVLENCAGKLVIPNTLTYVPLDWCDFQGKPLTLTAQTSKRYLSTRYDRDDYEHLCTLGVQRMSELVFLDDIKTLVQKDLKFFQAQELHWHANIARALQPFAVNTSFAQQIASLKLIPLRDGRWCSKHEVTAFFDNDDHGLTIPDGIDLMIVDFEAASDPDRAQLFRALGVKDLNSRTVMDIIIEKHQDPNFKPSLISKEALLQQAIFLYNLGWKNTQTQKIWCATERNGRLPTDQLYLDSSRPHSATKYFANVRDRFQFINDIYLRAVPKESQSWLTWLEAELKVAIYPRLAVPPSSGVWDFAPDFEHLLQHHSSKIVFMLLRDKWSIYSDFIGEEAFETDASRCRLRDKLSKSLVMCQDGITRKLDETYLPTSEVAQLAKGCAPFLDVSEPEDPRWITVLTPLGVRSRPDLKLYLRTLVKTKDENPSLEQVKDLFDLIQAWEHSNPAEVIDPFEENSLIFIPRSEKEPEATWVAPSACVWDGPKCLQFTHILKDIYPQNQSLFNVLGIHDANIETLLQEAEAVSSSDDISYVSSLFIGMEKMLKEDKAGTISTDLISRPIFPICRRGSTDGFHKLVRACSSDKWFIADCTHFQRSFVGKLPLLALSASDVCQISRILKRARLGERLLSFAASGTCTASGKVSVEEAATNGFRSKVDSILRLVPETETNRAKIFQQLRNVKCFSADQVIQTWSVKYKYRTVEGEPEDGQIALQSDDTSLHIYFAEPFIGKSSSDSELAEKLAGFCGFEKATEDNIDRKYLLLCIINATEQDEIDELLDQHRIPPLVSDDELAEEQERISKQLRDAKGKGKGKGKASIFSRGFKWNREPRSRKRVPIRPKTKARKHWGPSIFSRGFKWSREPRSLKRVSIRPKTKGPSIFSRGFKWSRELRSQKKVKKASKRSTPTKVKDAKSAKQLKIRRALALYSVLLLSGKGHSMNAPALISTTNLDAKVPLVNIKVFAISNKEDSGSQADWNKFKANLPAGPILNNPAREKEAEKLQALGEVFVSKLLATKILGKDYDPKVHWTSPHRHSASILSKLRRTSHAPFTIDDSSGDLTSFLSKLTNIAESWATKPPTYHLDVKATSGGLLESFNMSWEEFERARRYRVPETGLPTDVSILVRVWGLEQGAEPNVTVFLDPWAWYMSERVGLKATGGLTGVLNGTG